MAYTVRNGTMVPVGAGITGADTQSPQQRRHPPQLHLAHAQQDTPNEVSGAVDTLSKPTAREAELLT